MAKARMVCVGNKSSGGQPRRQKPSQGDQGRSPLPSYEKFGGGLPSLSSAATAEIPEKILEI